MKPSKRVFILVLLALLSAFAAHAQATVGVPYTLDLGAGLAGIVGSYPGFTFNVTFEADSSGLPPGMTFSGLGLLSGTPTRAGQFNFNVTITYIIIFTDVQADPIIIPATFPFALIVSGGTGPVVSVSPGALSYSLTTAAPPAQQSIAITNRGAAPVSFQASATGGSWLTVSGGGTAAAFGQGSVTATVNPSSLAPGTYTGAVTISGSFTGSPLKIPVVVTVTGAQPLLSLSQNGLFFRASAGGPAPPAQNFTVSNIGVGSLSWTAAATTFSGGSWLSVSPASGQSTATSAPLVTIQANPSKLAAGTYYGEVLVSSPGVPNSPQSVSVVLNVAAATISVDPDVRPTGLIFVGKVGGPNPAAQKVILTNLGLSAVTYATSLTYASGSGWLSVTPPGGSLVSGIPSSPAVTPSISKLAAGVYQAQISFVFNEPKTTRNVSVLLIILPATSGISAPETGAARGAAHGRSHRPDQDRVRAARVPHAARRRGADPAAADRARVGLRLRRRPAHRGRLRPHAAREDRPPLPPVEPADRPRDRLPDTR